MGVKYDAEAISSTKERQTFPAWPESASECSAFLSVPVDFRFGKSWEQLKTSSRRNAR